MNNSFEEVWLKIKEVHTNISNESIVKDIAIQTFEAAKPKWLSLDLAPRDGTKFLVKFENGVIYSNCYFDYNNSLQTVIWGGSSRTLFEDDVLFMYNP